MVRAIDLYAAEVGCWYRLGQVHFVTCDEAWPDLTCCSGCHSSDVMELHGTNLLVNQDPHGHRTDCGGG